MKRRHFLTMMLLTLTLLLGRYEALAQNVIVNKSFETPSISGFQYNPTGSNWTFTGLPGIAPNGSSLSNVNAPDGVQVAFLQGANAQGSILGSVSQLVYFRAGTYYLTIAAAARTGNALQPVQFSVDGVNVGAPLTPAGTSFADVNTVAFTVANGAHTIKFTATDNTSDKTTIIVNIRLNTIPSPTLTHAHMPHSVRTLA